MEWYTASHLSNVFTRATLREKINAFSPAILAGPVPEDETSEYRFYDATRDPRLAEQQGEGWDDLAWVLG